MCKQYFKECIRNVFNAFTFTAEVKKYVQLETNSRKVMLYICCWIVWSKQIVCAPKHSAWMAVLQLLLLTFKQSSNTMLRVASATSRYLIDPVRKILIEIQFKHQLLSKSWLCLYSIVFQDLFKPVPGNLWSPQHGGGCSQVEPIPPKGFHLLQFRLDHQDLGPYHQVRWKRKLIVTLNTCSHWKYGITLIECGYDNKVLTCMQYPFKSLCKILK